MSDLQVYKDGLIATYLNLFAYSAEQDVDGEIFSTLSQSIGIELNREDIVAFIMNKAIVGKNRNSARGYALLTKDYFYGVDVNEHKVRCAISDIVDVVFEKTNKKGIFSSVINAAFENGVGIVVCEDGRKYRMTSSVANRLKGFALINTLQDRDDTKYKRFLLDSAEKVFGEVVDGKLNSDEKRRIKAIFPEGAEAWIESRCRLKDVTLDGAFFEISIKDTDIKYEDADNGCNSGYFSEDEWEKAVHTYKTTDAIREVYLDCIKRTLGLEYEGHQLHFNSNLKTSMSTRVNNVVNTIENVSSKVQEAATKMQEITETRMAEAEKDYWRQNGDS